MLDSLFQLLFAYRPVVFSQGELRFAAWGGSYLAIGAALAAALAAVWAYRAGGGKMRPRDRVVLTALRVARTEESTRASRSRRRRLAGGADSARYSDELRNVRRAGLLDH